VHRIRQDTDVYGNETEHLSYEKYLVFGLRGESVGINTIGTVLQTVRSRVRFPLVLLEFLIDIILSVALWPWG
jgi:hypothetical protein